MPIPTNVMNNENVSFVAIVTDANNNALNSRAAGSNVDQTFQENL